MIEAEFFIKFHFRLLMSTVTHPFEHCSIHLMPTAYGTIGRHCRAITQQGLFLLLSHVCLRVFIDLEPGRANDAE